MSYVQALHQAKESKDREEVLGMRCFSFFLWQHWRSNLLDRHSTTLSLEPIPGHEIGRSKNLQDFVILWMQRGYRQGERSSMICRNLLIMAQRELRKMSRFTGRENNEFGRDLWDFFSPHYLE
jgi:hypothetical protein